MAVIFTREQGLALLATSPEVVKKLSAGKSAEALEYKSFFVALQNEGGKQFIETLESDGKFDLPILGAVDFNTLAFIAMSKMSLQSNGDYNNVEQFPQFAEVVSTAQSILSQIEAASDGKYVFYDKNAVNPQGKTSPREPLREFVAARLA